MSEAGQKPIRILHVIGVLNRGGAEAMIMNLYRNIDRTKVQFDFVENTDETGIYEQEIRDCGGRIYHCPKFSGNVISYMKWWDDFFDHHMNEFAFVHGHIGSTAAMYLHSAKKHGIPTIAHSHNVFRGYDLKQIEYRVLSWPTRFISDYFFACSKEAGISRYGRKASFRVIRNAIDTKLFVFREEDRKQILDELHIDEKTAVFGHIGRFWAQKNHVFLIDIFKEILKIHPDSVLLLVGDGPLKEETEQRVISAGLQDRIRFLGVREDIPKMMCALDVMIFPSVYEGLPVTLVESQCLGLKCLMSDVISDETILCPEMIEKMSLNESAHQWAEKALQMRGYERKSFVREITEQGFDIAENAARLQEFYLSGGNV